MGEIVLELAFEIENVSCISYKCVLESYWEKILGVLETNPDIVIEPKIYQNRMELFGNKFTSKRFIEEINVIVDPDKISAFKTFYGEIFFTGINILDELFNMCDKFLQY